MQVEPQEDLPPPPTTPEEVAAVERDWLERVYKGDSLPELTLQVVIVSVFLGALMIAFNIYMGLKTGWGEGGSLIAVILGFTIMKALGRKYSILENNATQTFASAAGSLGNIVNVIPALFLLHADGLIERTPTFMDVLLWVFFTSFLGVFFAIPLRRQMLVVDRLTFPTGTAAAQTIQAMHAKGDEAVKKGRALGITGLVSGIFTWFRDGIPAVIPGYAMAPSAIKVGGISIANLTMGMALSPMMFGAGFLIGPRIGISLAIGGAVAWAGLAPWLHGQGIDMWIAESMTAAENLQACQAILAAGTPDEAGMATLGADCKYMAQVVNESYYSVMVKWLMWPGIGMMVAAGLTSTAMKWKIMLKAVQGLFNTKGGKSPIAHLEVPTLWWVGGAIVSSIGVLGMLKLRFGVPVLFGVAAIALSFVLAVIAVRATGETDINPVGSMGSITQIAFGAAQSGSTAAAGSVITANLLTGGVAASGASEAADMMQDLKTGWLLGATPRRQFLAQLMGVAVGSVFCAGIFWVLIQGAPIGSEQWPAPAAITWSGLATMMAKGASALPPHAMTGLGVGIAIGVLLPILEKVLPPSVRKYLPSAVGLGVAMVVPYMYAFSMFLGSMLYAAIRAWRPKLMADYAGAIGAGGIAGEGLIGVLAAGVGLLM
jgi:OPT family oligopeptide transporter